MINTSRNLNTNLSFVKGDNLYKYLFNNVEDSIIIFDPATEKILDANESCVGLYGYGKENFIGKSLLEFTQNPRNGKKGIETVLSKGKINNFHTIHYSKDGRELSLEAKATLTEFNGHNAILSVYRKQRNNLNLTLLNKKAKVANSDCRCISELNDGAKDLEDKISEDYSNELLYSVNRQGRLEFNLFNELDKNGLEKLDKFSSVKVISKNESIYMEGDSANFIFILKSGRVKIVEYSSNGRENILTVINPGEIFGDVAYMNYINRNDYAIALMPSVVYSIDKNNFIKLFNCQCSLNCMFTKSLRVKVCSLSDRIKNLLYKEAHQRIIATIIWLVCNSGKITDGKIYIKPFLIHQDIAELSACSRQTVNNVLTDLRDKGILDFNHKMLVIKKIDQLKSYL